MVNTFFVVSGIINYKGKYLILRKSLDDPNFPGKWSFCSGFVKEFEPAEVAVLREIKEETGLNVKISRASSPVEVRYKDKRFIIICFLCNTNSNRVKLDNENIDYRWIKLNELGKFEFVPGILKDVEALGLKVN